MLTKLIVVIQTSRFRDIERIADYLQLHNLLVVDHMLVTIGIISGVTVEENIDAITKVDGVLRVNLNQNLYTHV